MSKKLTVLHFFKYLPEKYSTRYWDFAQARLPEFEHRSFAWINQLYDRNGVVDSNRFRRRVKLARSFVRAFRAAHAADVVVFHSLFFRIWHLWPFLLWPGATLRKSIWCIWGADLYRYQNRPRGGMARLTEDIRKKLIPRIGYGTSLVPGDLDVATQVYGFSGARFRAFYPNPVDYSLARRVVTESANKEKASRVIMIGNSADPTNQHVPVLQALHGIWDGKFDVYLPLAYGKSGYANEVARIATDLFGTHARIQRTFIQPDEYGKVLQSVDVAIYNHNRQQGLGNIFFLLAAGKKLYIRSDTTSYAFLEENHLPVYCTEHLLGGQVSCEQLFEFRVNEEVFERVINLVSDDRAEQEWRTLFQTIGKQ